MTPGAGAHGELCGMMAIRSAIDAKGESRRRVLVPESAHGTNPATAAALGFTVDEVPADDRGGKVDLEAFKAKLGDDVAGIMLTNPNTCGLFENDIVEIAEAIHGVGGYFYCDGATPLQRHRRASPAGGSRHRRDAHQPAQDVLDAARRRRARAPGRWCCRRCWRPMRRCRP